MDRTLSGLLDVAPLELLRRLHHLLGRYVPQSGAQDQSRFVYP